ncbi:TPA: hypothetical protein MFM57_005308 [Klebsiella pneumoniae]|nr:hypothetical protein [Klebsiella pneumoniae]
MVCVVGRMRDLILQLSKSSIYSTKPVCFVPKAEVTNSSLCENTGSRSLHIEHYE